MTLNISNQPSAARAPDVHPEFTRRCAQLGVPCWKLDLASGALIEPEEPAALGPFLHAPGVRTMIQSAANAMAQADAPAVATPFPGWTLVPFVQSDFGKRVGLTLALILSDSATESAQFNLACASASLNPCNVRPVLQSVVRPKGFDLNPTLTVLTWTWEDLLMSAQQRSMFLGTVGALIAATEAKDPYNYGHSERVSVMAVAMGRAMKLDEVTIENFRLGGLVHDVGKIGIPEAILTKRGRLSPGEITLVQRHPEIGHKILKDIPLLSEALPGVLHHHERFDGLGYPHGLAGENIPLIARVLALADTFDAMSSNRSYRMAMPREKVLDEMRTCAGTQFDAALVEVFLKLDFAGVEALLTQHKARQAA
jgi:HD-GYP domain-containing protein (c-di-GMP phosphodiesterase class II)